MPDIDPPLGRVYLLAIEVLIHLVGKQWIANNIFGKRPVDGFLRSKPQKKDDVLKLLDRVIELAEMLFNFQDISGIENLVKRLTEKDSIESCVAELQAAKLLYNNKIPFSFNTPSYRKGDDYDAIAIVQGLEIACEFKCKVEATDFSGETIKESLREARKQLPKEKPCIIFVKIPEVWTTQRGTEESLLKILAEFFRRTTRVNSVIFHWEEWYYFPDEKSARGVKYKEEVNPNSKISLGKILNDIKLNAQSEKWTYFSDLIKVKFGESGFTRPTPIKALILGNGFSWNAVIKILPQPKSGEHVIYEIGVSEGPRLTILIDKDSYIRFRVVDANLSSFELKTDKPISEIGLDVFAYLRCQLTPIFSLSQLSIAVNNKIVYKNTVPLNQNSVLLPNTTLGADLKGKRHTAFELTELAIFEKSTSIEENNKITEYFNKKFALANQASK